MNRYAKYLAAFLLAAYALYRLYRIFLQPMEISTANFVDDTYYYLKIAQNIVIYGYPTFDGINATNGFQPLWQILLIPFYLFSPYSYMEVYYAVQVFLTILFLIIAAIFYQLAARRVSPVAGVIAVLVLLQFRYSTILIKGMEASILLFFFLLLYHVLSSGGGFIEREGKIHRGKWTVGLLMALALLSRLDSVFYLLATGLAFFTAWILTDRSRRCGFFAAALPMVIPPAITLAVYLAINKISFGHFLPISGMIKSHFPNPEFHPGFFKFYPWLTVLGLYGLWVVARSGISLLAGRFQDLDRRERSYLLADGAFGLGYWFHACWVILFMVWHVWDYYFVGVLVLIVPLTRDLNSVIEWVGRSFKIPKLRDWGYALVIVILMFTAVFLELKLFRILIGPAKVRTREAAVWIRENTPPETIICGTDCGGLGYFSQRRTVNLDGLVNNYEYQAYLDRGEFARYLEEKGVDYLVVFEAPSEALFNGTYESYEYTFWSNSHRRRVGHLSMHRDQEVYRSRFNPRDPHHTTGIIIWRLPWCDQPLLSSNPDKLD